jgi:hypothetical protein
MRVAVVRVVVVAQLRQELAAQAVVVLDRCQLTVQMELQTPAVVAVADQIILEEQAVQVLLLFLMQAHSEAQAAQ